jgi:hypothetical protein
VPAASARPARRGALTALRGTGRGRGRR